MLEEVIVPIGSANDCDILVEKFSKSESLSFADFAREWKASHFELIFCGRSSEELPLIASELLAIAKAILLNVNKEFASRVGALYLMYGLYFTQETKSKVRLTLSEFKEFTKFTTVLKEKKIIDAEFVFQKLFIGKAFLFCACSTPNKCIQMNQTCQSEEDIGNPMDENECRLIGCEGLSSNCLKNLDLAHCKYEEKKQIAGFITTPSSAAPSQHFPDEIRIILDDTDSEIAEMKSNGIKQGESTSDSGVVINQGVIRRGIVNSSFSQIRSRRMPVDVTSYDLTRKTKSKPDDSGNH
ncbi:snRNA-activating protein complex subunit 1-like [Daphnia pulex]|uniref:snRNA-activating protein complex subunit 1-like n=1 Tax=Daphnia pulex TaxID=6669 RepID=UPI001EDD7564|nr:snRNA-activating protein complex subunit 1-like [Daphnia pulex]